MPFADSDGTRLYYDDRGTGEPVILCLPGWAVHHTMFAPLAERLSADHRVLAIGADMATLKSPTRILAILRWSQMS